LRFVLNTYNLFPYPLKPVQLPRLEYEDMMKSEDGLLRYDLRSVLFIVEPDI